MSDLILLASTLLVSDGRVLPPVEEREELRGLPVTPVERLVGGRTVVDLAALLRL